MATPTPLPRAFQPPDQSAIAVYNEFRPNAQPPVPEEDPTGNPYDDGVKRAVRRAFITHRLHKDLDQTLGPRTVCAWRITRTMARVMGHIYADEFLCEIEDKDVWTTPAPGSPDKFPAYFAARSKALILSSNQALTPHEQTIHVWCRLIRTIAEDLTIGVGSMIYPDLGLHGLMPLTDPDTAVMAWPSREQIFMFEQILIEDCLAMLTTNSTGFVRAFLREHYGLTAPEISEALKLARREGVSYAESTVEEDRALMVLRLEEMFQAAQKAYDTRAGAQILKLQAQIQGIMKAESKNPFDDVIDTLGKVRDKQRALPGGNQGETDE